MAERALGLKRLFEGNPIEVREALRRYFVDGRIVVTPVAEGYYVAEGQFLPLVALTYSTLDSAPFWGAEPRGTLVVARGGFEPPTFGL